MNRYVFLMIVFFGFNFDCLFGSNVISVRSYADIQSMISNLALEDIESFVRPFFAVDKVKFEDIDKNDAYFVNMFGCEIKDFEQVKELLNSINIHSRKVVALNLSFNKIENISFADMQDFKNLQFFSAYNNEIKNIDSDAFYKNKISTLMISNNNLTDLLFFNPILFSQRSFLFNFAENLITAENLRMYIKTMVTVVNTQKFVDTFNLPDIEKDQEIREYILKAFYDAQYLNNQLDPIIFLSTNISQDGLLKIDSSKLNIFEKYKKLLVCHHNSTELYNLISKNKLLVKPLYSENKLIIFKNILGYFDENAPEPQVEEFDYYQYLAKLYVILKFCDKIN